MQSLFYSSHSHSYLESNLVGSLRQGVVKANLTGSHFRSLAKYIRNKLQAGYMTLLNQEQSLQVLLQGMDVANKLDVQLGELVAQIYSPPLASSDKIVGREKLPIALISSCLIFVSALTIPDTLRQFLQVMLLREEEKTFTFAQFRFVMSTIAQLIFLFREESELAEPNEKFQAVLPIQSDIRKFSLKIFKHSFGRLQLDQASVKSSTSAYIQQSLNRAMRDLMLGESVAKSVIPAEAKLQAKKLIETKASVQRLEAISYLQRCDLEKKLIRTEQLGLGEVLNFLLRDMAFMLILTKIKGYSRLVLGGQFYASKEERARHDFYQFPCLICAIDQDPNLAVIPLKSNSYLFYQTNRLESFELGKTKLKIERPFDIKIKQVSACETHSLVLTEESGIFGLGENEYGGLGHLARSQKLVKLERIQVESLLNEEERIKQLFTCEHTSVLLTSEGRVLSSGLGQKGLLGRFDYKEMERVNGKLCMFGFGAIPEIEVTQLSVGKETIFARGTNKYYRWGTIYAGVDNGNPDSTYPKIQNEPIEVERLDPGVVEEVKCDGKFVVALGNALDLEIIVTMKDKKAKKIENTKLIRSVCLLSPGPLDMFHEQVVELPSRLEVMEDKAVPYIAFQPEAPLDHEDDRGDESTKAADKLPAMGKKMTSFKHQLSKKNTNFMMRTGTVLTGEMGRSEPQSDQSDSDDDQMDEDSSVASVELELEQLKSLDAPDLERGVQQTLDYINSCWKKKKPLFKNFNFQDIIIEDYQIDFLKIKLQSKEHDEQAEVSTPVKKESGPKLKLSKKVLKTPEAAKPSPPKHDQDSDASIERVRRVSIMNMSGIENRLSTLQSKLTDGFVREDSSATPLGTLTTEPNEEEKNEEDGNKDRLKEILKEKEESVPPPPYMPELLDKDQNLPQSLNIPKLTNRCIFVIGLSEGLPQHFIKKLVSFDGYNPDIVVLPLSDNWIPDYESVDTLSKRRVRLLFVRPSDYEELLGIYHNDQYSNQMFALNAMIKVKRTVLYGWGAATDAQLAMGEESQHFLSSAQFYSPCSLFEKENEALQNELFTPYPQVLDRSFSKKWKKAEATPHNAIFESEDGDVFISGRQKELTSEDDFKWGLKSLRQHLNDQSLNISELHVNGNCGAVIVQ